MSWISISLYLAKIKTQGGEMGILSGLIDAITSINWGVIANLFFVSLIMIAGPAVIFVLAFNGGDM